MKSVSSVFQLLKMIKKRIPALTIMTAANMLVAVLSVFFALGTRSVINAAVSGQWESFKNACVIQLLIIAGILLSLTCFRYLKERLSSEIDRDLKKTLLKSIIHSDFSETSEYHSGELINRATNDVRLVTDGLFGTLPGFASMVTKMALAFVALWSLQKSFAMVILVAGLAVVALTAIMRKGLKGLHKAVSEADGKVSSFFQEIFEKIIVVQAMSAEDEIEKRSDELLHNRYKYQMKRKNVSLFANTSVSVMSYIATFVALVWCASGILNGTMTFGDLTAVTQLVSQLQSPVVNLSGVIPQYVAMVAAAERLMEIFDMKADEETEKVDCAELYEKATGFECRELTFTYNRDTVLEKTSFSVPKGSFVLIKGSSGIGKSTLLKLMLGIYKSDEGDIVLKTREKDVLLNKSTRGLFAYVPQGNLLLSGSIRENLLLARPDADEKEIAKAVYVSCMDEYLGQLPMGLDTVLAENSGGLSEGQAQRIAIARAVLSNAPVLLLDEITSSLDAETEKKVLSRIKGLENRTCFVVTHRKVSDELCNLIFEIENGKIKKAKQ